MQVKKNFIGSDDNNKPNLEVVKKHLKKSNRVLGTSRLVEF